jgi:hypothetical protein
MPFAIFIASVHSPADPMRKSNGGNVPTSNRYAGVLPVPSSSSIASNTPNRLDSLLDQHHDARAERGRVLYAAGHAPASKAPAAPAKPHRRQCSDHVASARGSNNSPNS